MNNIPITISPNKWFAKKQDGTGYFSGNTVLEVESAAEMIDADIEAAMIATKAYPKNAFFIANSKLYRATKTIASGATISPGTGANNNCVLVTVMDMLDTVVTNGVDTETYAKGIELRVTGDQYALDCYGYLHYSTNPMTLPTLRYPKVSELITALNGLSAMWKAADQPLKIIHSTKYYEGFIMHDALEGSGDYKVVYIDDGDIMDAENNDYVFGTLYWTTKMNRSDYYPN